MRTEASVWPKKWLVATLLISDSALEIFEKQSIVLQRAEVPLFLYPADLNPWVGRYSVAIARILQEYLGRGFGRSVSSVPLVPPLADHQP